MRIDQKRCNTFTTYPDSQESQMWSTISTWKAKTDIGDAPRFRSTSVDQSESSSSSGYQCHLPAKDDSIKFGTEVSKALGLSGKMKVLVALLQQFHALRENTILFSRSIPSLDFVESLLRRIPSPNQTKPHTTEAPESPRPRSKRERQHSPSRLRASKRRSPRTASVETTAQSRSWARRCEPRNESAETAVADPPSPSRKERLDGLAQWSQCRGDETDGESGSQEVLGFQVMRMDGSTPPQQRAKLIDEFNGHGTLPKVFLVSTKAGGEGISLVGGTRVIMLDLSWNPCDDVQAIRRCYRFGQKRNVFIYRLVSAGSIEDKVFRRQLERESLASQIVDETKTARTFNAKYLEDVIKDCRQRIKTNNETCTRLLGKTVSIDQALRKAYNVIGQRWIADCKRYTVLLPQEKEERDEELRNTALQEYQREINVNRSLSRILAEKKIAAKDGASMAARRHSNPLPREVKNGSSRQRRPRIKRSRTSISSLLLKSELFHGHAIMICATHSLLCQHTKTILLRRDNEHRSVVHYLCDIRGDTLVGPERG
uniref:Helicase C-terminal domain-containing protein n=1 Tax=Lotharella globosa TaxID=91324 RepID=A0A6V3JD13_9EUKA